MKMVSAEDEKDLDATAPTDEDINEIFDFEEAHSNVINIIGSVDLNGTDNVGIKGATFDFKDELKKADWSWDTDSKCWLAPRLSRPSCAAPPASFHRCVLRQRTSCQTRHCATRHLLPCA